jgi:hypothetical protein
MKSLLIILLMSGIILPGYQNSETDKFIFPDLKSFYEPPAGKLNVKKMQQTFYNPFLIGKGSKFYTLFSGGEEPPYTYINFMDDEAHGYKGKIYETDIEIFTDTAQTISGRFLDFDHPKSDNSMEAIPVYLFNPSDKTTSVSTGSGFFMVQEAKNEQGEWKPIEYKVYPGCGLSYADFVLEPRYYLVTFAYKYYGDFETELRIVLKKNEKLYYSKPFKGSINRSQFLIPKEAQADSMSFIRAGFP